MVAGVVLGFIFLIIIIVLLATSAGSRSGSGGSPTGGLGPPGSAGNWTAAQVAEQVTTNQEKIGKFGLEKDFVDMISDCYIRSLSAFQTYDYTKGCSAEGAKCEQTEVEIRAMSSCFGGVKKGNWPPELKKLMKAVLPASTPPEKLHAWPCIIDYLSLNYDLTEVLAALKNAKQGDDLTRAINACIGMMA